MTIEYDGTDWHGWQIQPDRPTVQQAIENALETALRTPVSVVGSGRTDAGVHARGQVAHFRIESGVDPYRLAGQLNGILPDSVVVRDLVPAEDDFHARFGALRRRYGYYVSTVARPLDRAWRVPVYPEPDFDRMNRAVTTILGTHDFSAFCRAGTETDHRMCSVGRAVWLRERRPGDWCFTIEADRFLHGMVRTVVGTLLEIGRGRRPHDDMQRILDSRDRRIAGQAAPARGLVLESVEYDGDAT